MQNLIIGYGTGRCGSKSLAAFLDQQEDTTFTHEKIVSFYPQWGDYFDYLAIMFKYGTSFVGNISPGWVEYIDRIMVDFPDAKFVCLTREDVHEVAASFYSYLNYDWPEGDKFLTYPIHDFEITYDAIVRSVTQYMVKQEILTSRLGDRQFKLETKDLNNKDRLTELLTFLGIPKPWNLEMPWLNKREDMKR